MTENSTYHGLRRFNLIMAALHLVQGAVMLMISSNFSLPVTASFLELDPVTELLTPVPETLFRLQIGPVVATFLFVSALAHFTVSLPRVHGWYERNLGKGVNYARWIEYAVSSSIMIVVISMLVGVYDIVGLILVFSVNAAMILFGWMMELHNQSTKKTNWTAYWFGVLAGIVPWVAISIYLGGSEARGDVPGFVYGIYVSLFLFFNVFAVNMVLQYMKVGKWRNYLFGERAYIVLSLTAKSLLAWQVFAGTLQPA